MDRLRILQLRRVLASFPVRLGVPFVLVALFSLTCGGSAKGPESEQAPKSAPSPGIWHSFEGTGTAAGRGQALQLGPDRKVSIIHMTGSLLLTGEQRLGQGFRSEILGTFDSLKGGTAWCVWTDSRGDQVFSELRGERVGTGNRFVATFLGGTGRYSGVSGEYEFDWQYVIRAEDGMIQGRTVGLRGRFRVDAPPASPRREGSRREDGGFRERA
jgi:hypothetical protein